MFLRSEPFSQQAVVFIERKGRRAIIVPMHYNGAGGLLFEDERPQVISQPFDTPALGSALLTALRSTEIRHERNFRTHEQLAFALRSPLNRSNISRTDDDGVSPRTQGKGTHMARHRNRRPFDLDEFSLKLQAESDRACAVLGAAILDAKLEALIRHAFATFQDELLGSSRPLGSFSSRIRLARALNWISEEVCKDLDTIRDVRNDFAHDSDHALDFKNQSICARCGNLITAQAFLDGYDIAATTPGRNLSSSAYRSMKEAFSSPRARFQVSVEFLVQYLDAVRIPSVAYSGPDLPAEVRSKSANSRITVTGCGLVGSPADTSDKSEDDGAAS